MSSTWTEHLVACCLVLGMGICTASCSLPQPMPVIVHEGAYDIVLLEPLSGETPAHHPAIIEQAVMETILRGIYIQDDERLLQRLLSGRMPPLPVFSEDQVSIVSRILVAAFAQATPRQQIGFRLSSPQSHSEETTEGILYYSAPFLHFTLRQFHSGQSQARLENPGRQLRDPTGLGSRRLVFQLSGGSTGRPVVETRSPMTLIINYSHIQQWLASRGTAEVSADGRLTPVTSTPAVEKNGREQEDQPPAMRSTPSLNDLIVRKDLEIESLKEEIRTLRHAVDAQQRELNRMKRRLEDTRQP